MPTGPSKKAAASPAWMRLALVVFSMLVALGLIEGAVRIRQWSKYGRPAGAAFEAATDPASGLRIPKPNFDTGKIKIDSRGFRSPELEVPKPPGRIRLAFVGASTTFCAEVSSNEATWPQLVRNDLAAHYPDLAFDFVNGGVPGYSVESMRKNLEFRIAPVAPDVIVYYEASNDLSKDTRALAKRTGLYDGTPEDPSPVAKVSVAWYLVEKNLLVRERQRLAHTAPRLVYNADSLAQGFEVRLRDLLAEARTIAPVCAAATFSHKVRRDQSPDVQLLNCSSSLYYTPYMSVKGLLDGWDAYNRAIRKAAREAGVILVDGEDSIPADDAHFADSVHFLDPGARSMADRVTAGLVASREFEQLIESRRRVLAGK